MMREGRVYPTPVAAPTMPLQGQIWSFSEQMRRRGALIS